jgi:lipoate-protein ligase A
MIPIRVDHFKDISFADPSENILYDDVLLSLAEEGKLGNTLRIWESPVYFVVLGRTGKVEEDLDLENLKADAVPVLRRSSGGGTVVQGAGCLNYSFVLSKETTPALNDLRGSYHIILEGVLTLLSNLNINAVFRPISDLALQNSLSAKVKDYLVKSANASRSLLGIINDILDFSKIEAGRLDMEAIDFTLEEVLGTMSSMIFLKAQEI